MRTAYRIIVAVVFAVVILAVHALPAGRLLEREYGLPLLYSLRGPVPVPNEALIVGLDNTSVAWLTGEGRRIEDRAPDLAACLSERAREDLRGAANINHIPRSVHVCLLKVLSARKPKVILFDINFSRERHDDAALAQAFRDAGNVLLFERIDVGDALYADRRRPRAVFIDAALGTMGFHADSARGEVVTGYVTGFRDYPDLQTMPVAAWSVWTGKTPPPRLVEVQPLWFYGPPQAIKTVSLRDIFDPETPDPLPADLSNVAVFIGSSDPEDAGIDDHFPVPTLRRGDRLIGGVELAATGFLNLLHGDTLRRLSPGGEALIVFALALLGALAVLTLTRWWLSVTLIILSAGYLAAAALAFSQAKIWLPVAVPVYLNTLCLALAAVSVRYFFVRTLVGRLVPRQVAASLLDSTVADRRAARTEQATIVFTDLIGSTAMAEALDETEYARAANLYYDNATEIVESQNGMVVEFLGDGVLAMFSESVTGSDHAARACRAALELAARVDQRNAETPDLPDLRLRVGINTGLTSTGDIGARTRFNYKALGDAVNVAARLEQHGKSVDPGNGHLLLVSHTTWEAAAGTGLSATPLGSMDVRGRANGIDVYQLNIP